MYLNEETFHVVYTRHAQRGYDKKWKVTAHGHRAHKCKPDEWADEPNASWPQLQMVSQVPATRVHSRSCNGTMLLDKNGSVTAAVDFFFKIFNWRIIALQNCDGFCHPSTWISLCHTANSHQLSVLHMVMYVFMSLSQLIPPSPFLTASTSLFSMSVSPLLHHK